MKKRTSIWSLMLALIMITLPIAIVGMSMCQILGHSIFPTMSVCQTLGKTISPRMSLWGSHITTIILSAIIATAGAYFLLRKREALIAQLHGEIAERMLAEKELQNKGKLLRDLSARLREVEESERKRLAAELHDLVGQNLGVLEINLNIIREAMPGDIPQPTHELLRDAFVKVEDTVKGVRRVIADLRPPILDDFGLKKTITWYSEEFFHLTGIKMETKLAKLCPRLPAKTEEALFRIIQEALVNVQKHAHATKVTVSLNVEDNTVRLQVGDNGVGFDRASTDRSQERKCWGLVIMAERADAVGGHFSIRSRPGQGTQITVEVRR